MNKLLVALLMMCLLVTCNMLETTMAMSAQCHSKCRNRCAKAKVKGRCVKYCGTCCAKCKCVPAYGNKRQCPCYRNARNSKGKPKCP